MVRSLIVRGLHRRLFVSSLSSLVTLSTIASRAVTRDFACCSPARHIGPVWFDFFSKELT
jgi:hypothetical protein